MLRHRYDLRRDKVIDMKISLPTENGFLPDKYGKYAPAADRKYDHAVCSFPITIEEVPEGTQTLALTFIDYDSTPVCGFTWIHWLMCEIDPNIGVIPEDASQNPQPEWRQGFNSCFSNMEEIDNDLTVAQAYIGPRPPDADHTYTLRVYALDNHLDLAEGYFYNQLHFRQRVFRENFRNRQIAVRRDKCQSRENHGEQNERDNRFRAH